MKNIGSLLLVVAVICLAGCANNLKYQKAGSVKATSIYPGMTTSSVKAYYSIPAGPTNTSGKEPDLLPPGVK